MRFHYHQCFRNAVAQEKGKHYCKQHLPSARKAKRDAKYAQWEAARLKRYADEDRRRHKLAMFDELLDTLKSCEPLLKAVSPKVCKLVRKVIDKADGDAA